MVAAPALPAGMWLAPMCPAHAADIEAVQRALYPARYLESTSHILARAAAFPSGSLVVLMRAAAGVERLAGYAQAYPWPAAAAAAAPPSLCDSDAPAMIAAAVAAPADALLFIHEVSVYVQGRGLGSVLLAGCAHAGRAAGLRHAMLVAVLGQGSYWQRHGFVRERDLSPGYYDTAPAADALPQPPRVGDCVDLPPMPTQGSDDSSAVVMSAPLSLPVQL